MALPPRLHYGLVRLRSLNRPTLWGTGLGVALLAIVGYQYGHHPEWLSSFELSSDNPARLSAGPDGAALSGDDLAGLAEVDNLALLLNQLQPVTADTLDPVATSDSVTPSVSLQLPQPEQTAGLLPPTQTILPSPFAAYLARTQFRVNEWANLGATDSAQGALGPTVVSPSRSGLTPTATTTNGEGLSPLQQALTQALSASQPGAAVPTPGTEVNAGAETGSPRPDAPQPTTSGLEPPPWLVEGSLPGVNQRFIRTTPEMSPPAGTTGYTVPPTLPRPSEGVLPQPAPLNLNLSPAAIPTAPRPAVGTPASTLPPPFESGLSQPRSQPEPAPFSVPRPPGSHTGGGYIYTFSNPNGP
jgi:hypothetical protein